MGLLINDKEVVVPGEILATGMDYLPAYGTFREQDKIIAHYLGLVSITGRLIRLVPLRGRFIAKPGDVVIGRIANITMSNWFVDIGTPYEASLSMKDATSDFVERGSDLSQYFNIGELIITEITNVIKNKIIDLTMKGPGLRKLKGGRIIEVIPSKVPRIIGKQGSMISLVKDATNCRITVGQNGRIWISSEDPEKELVAIKAIQMIESEAHLEGLTDRIKEFLSGEVKHQE